MSMSNYLLMPISKEAFANPEKTRQVLDLLIGEGLASADNPTDVWSYPYDAEDEDYGEAKLPYATLRELRDALDRVDMQEVNFDVGFSRYGLESKDDLPGMNQLTEELQTHMAEFCASHAIDYTLDVYGHVTIGFIAPDSEDEQGELRGIGVMCDGSSAVFMEEAGYLEAAKEIGIYRVFEKIAAIYGEKPSLQFRN
ncbi:hypothetical protein [Acidovorax sp. 1608163]|uniref:hypothetical protein n=1 Tax=Acidovorax sp. 1608163 TaxID=2478662 RepID=UPI0013CE8565|nr:hypothetical protein [Acidovorax sp. 1608163]